MTSRGRRRRDIEIPPDGDPLFQPLASTRGSAGPRFCFPPQAGSIDCSIWKWSLPAGKYLSPLTDMFAITGDCSVASAEGCWAKVRTFVPTLSMPP